MPLRVRFSTPKANVKTKEPPFVIISESTKWRRTYIPPWNMFYNFAEIIILVVFFILVSQPVIYYYFLERTAFVDAFYPDMDEADPIHDFSQIQDFYNATISSLDDVLKDSFMEVYTTERKAPVLCEVYWLNGTISSGELPELDLAFFRHIKKLVISVDFVTISQSKENPGCSNWMVNTEIEARNGLVEFTVVPSISRVYCDSATMKKLGLVTNGNTTSKLQGRRLFEVPKGERAAMKKQKELASRLGRRMKQYKNKHLRKKDKNKAKKFDKGNFRLHKEASIQAPPKPLKTTREHGWFNRDSTQMFRYTNRLMLCLILINFVHIIMLFFGLNTRYKRHKKWMNNATYRNLPALVQVHFSIGYWYIVDIICSLCVFSFAMFVFAESYKITQFPSQLSIEIISFGLLFSLVRLNQWFAFHAPFYTLITIIREAALLLFNLAIAIIPICTSFVLFGVFTFGLISKSFLTINQLVQRFITSGIGDSIDDFYIVIDDGTERTAWLSFFYVSCITAGGMWIIITSCISSVMYVHESYAVEHDSFWKSSTESESSSD